MPIVNVGDAASGRSWREAELLARRNLAGKRSRTFKRVAFGLAGIVITQGTVAENRRAEQSRTRGAIAPAEQRNDEARAELRFPPGR